MRCLTPAECSVLAERLGVAMLEGGGVKFLDQWYLASAQLEVPNASGVQSAFVNAMFDVLGARNQWLIWVKAWGIFASLEYPVLWTAIRERYSESRPLVESPGHLFLPQEEELARGMMRLSLLFSWDAFLITEPVSFIAFTSHDDLAFFYAANAETLRELSARFAQLDLTLSLL